MTSSTYASLPASQGTSLAAALEQLCAPEVQSATLGPIKISSAADLDAAGPNLTPSMRQWLAANIESTRRLAWGALAAQARAIRVREVDGIVLEIEQDRIERDKQREIGAVLERFNDRYKRQIADVSRLKREYEEQRQLENNRDVKMPSLWLEWGILLPLILIPESLLNFSSFQRVWYIQSDFTALAATIFVGVALAGAAFLLGLFTLRTRYYLHPVDQQKRWKGISMLVGGLFLLTFSIGMVAVARYYLLRQLIIDAVLSGTTPPSMLVSVGSLLLGNLIAFLLGAVLTFMLNDPNERYYEKARALKKEQGKLVKVREHEVLRPVEAREEAARRELEQMQHRDRQMASATGYADFRANVSQLQAKDIEIIGLLESYRAGLAQAIRVAQPRFTFLQHAPRLDRAEAEQQVDMSDFLQLNLRLWRLS